VRDIIQRKLEDFQVGVCDVGRNLLYFFSLLGLDVLLLLGIGLLLLLGLYLLSLQVFLFYK
jgi:hypothetical protein